MQSSIWRHNLGEGHPSDTFSKKFFLLPSWRVANTKTGVRMGVCVLKTGSNQSSPSFSLTYLLIPMVDFAPSPHRCAISQVTTMQSSIIRFVFCGQKHILPKIFTKTCFLCMVRTVYHIWLFTHGFRNSHRHFATRQQWKTRSLSENRNTWGCEPSSSLTPIWIVWIVILNHTRWGC